MKLHGSLVSPYVARVVMYARAKGLDLQAVPVSDSPGDPGSDLLLGQPLFEAGGRRFENATAICAYLDERFPARRVQPTDPAEVARSREVVRTLDGAVLSRLTPLVRNLDSARRHAGEVEAAIVQLNAGLHTLEGLLGGSSYAAGSTLSVADCALLPGIALLTLLFVPAFRMQNPVATLPGLREWWAQMGEDPLAVLMLQEWTMAFQALTRTR